MRPFTRSTEYAIRALTYLAMHREGVQFHLAREMSESLGIPAPFLGKILQPLVMRGILDSQRGRNGGFRLAKEPSEVSLFEIANTQELIYEKRQCFLGQAECSDERACPMHEYWKIASADFETRMASTTLQGLIDFTTRSQSSEYPFPEKFADGFEAPPSMDALINQPADAEDADDE